MSSLHLRKLKSFIFLIFCLVSASIALFFLLFILYEVIKNGLQAFNIALFSEDFKPAFLGGGGLRHALVGQFLMTIVASIIGIPLGIAGGIYVAEYGKGTRTAKLLSNISDMAISVPSIIVGTFIFGLIVMPFHGFSGWAGTISLIILLLPIIIRSTEENINQVSPLLRETAYALGAPRYLVIKDVVLKSAKQGIITGVILAISRIAGETAPLLFTSANFSQLTFDMSNVIPSLTITIYDYTNLPDQVYLNLAWSGSLLVTIVILFINILARYIFTKK